MNQKKFLSRSLLTLGLLFGLTLQIYGQKYQSISIGIQQMGFPPAPFSVTSLIPRYLIGNNKIQVTGALEFSLNSVLGENRWAKIKLLSHEKVKIKRNVFMLQIGTPPETGSLGFIFLGINYYQLYVVYQYVPVLGQIKKEFRLDILNLGTGIFKYWGVAAKSPLLIGVEIFALSDFNETIDIWLKSKLIIRRDLIMGLKMEAFDPKPRFGEIFFGFFVEYKIL